MSDAIPRARCSRCGRFERSNAQTVIDGEWVDTDWYCVNPKCLAITGYPPEQDSEW